MFCKSFKIVLLLYCQMSIIQLDKENLLGVIFMATKTANLYARIEPDVKEQAESILSSLGIPASNAINMFYKQIILQKGLPFEVKLPTAKPVEMGSLTKTELDSEIEKGYADMLEGRAEPAEKVFDDIRRGGGNIK